MGAEWSVLTQSGHSPAAFAYTGRTAYPKRPCGQRKPVKAIPIGGIAKLEAKIRAMLNG